MLKKVLLGDVSFELGRNKGRTEANMAACLVANGQKMGSRCHKCLWLCVDPSDSGISSIWLSPEVLERL